ncbi:hypothetical protein Kpol_1013p31 [Vanderwaltozyma polyspora DSM 70294]|uniref:Glycogen debranching enzyme n=1 Tax=Vanderwaltozyma polyspora (strain ATCC 22028 / DSM 70294 / BCRC 21397 / CBS 2163 / NBRC 10782 / NRRL Y-8283 / UCD 57-17) TaxID=436907 RepID=A7TH79_VANPO|nr:uncharacterized protein Kpol_1013p31 [Vanderwaltozyma polyspora DSM 70294]EDO18360.1 hypothetical protein Kpol_1013p31 [Vanderwaltozyma polyspora DSM 70294]
MSFDPSSKRTLLLRLGEYGEPIANNSSSDKDGVLTLPSLPCNLENDLTNNEPIYTLRLLIAAGSPISRDGLIWTNCPPDSGTIFNRGKFYKKTIKSTFYNDDTIDLEIFRPGSFCFYISFRNKSDNLQTTKKYYFVLPPSLSINKTFLPLNSINCQTIVSKWLGNDLNKEWFKIFEKVSNKGYNMIHFTPLTIRGESNSPYSIYDQLEFDPKIFPNNIEDVDNMVKRLQKDYGILSLTDIVFNHTANNSQWLREHPEAGYNHVTAPHLIAAMELDEALLEFSKELKHLNYPCSVESEDDLFKIMDGIKIHVLGQLKLWEYYVINIEETLELLEKSYDTIDASKKLIDNEQNIINDIPESTLNNVVELSKIFAKDFNAQPFHILGERNFHTIDNDRFVLFLKKFKNFDKFDKKVEDFVTNLLNEINLPLYRTYDDDVNEILEQLYNRIKYLRLDGHGPKLGNITDDSPLTEPYFTRFVGKDGVKYALANNGWIWNGNPLVDFASPQTKSYLRREVIVWGDCVKLRYGKSPEDSPYLWDRMSKYVEVNAKIFNGFRIDNCHSTPLHVGEYFLDLARKFNPNLYVVAELFSGSETTDCLYVERLAISSLIREAMQCWSEDELARLVYNYGGRPIGSYKFVPTDNIAYSPDLKLDSNYHLCNKEFPAVRCVSEIMIPKILSAQPPHALFMDCTHDNQMPYQKRTVEDTLPNAALVALCSSAIGSVYGYDEIFPSLLDLVNEKRQYCITDCPQDEGIGKVKKLLNELRDKMAKISTDIEDAEMHVHQEGQYITFHRVNSKKGAGFYLIARTKFNDFGGDQKLPPIVLSHATCDLQFAYTLEKAGDVPKDDKTYIKGIPTKLKELKGFKVTYDEQAEASTITLPDEFPQGSIAIFATQQNEIDDELDQFIRSGAIQATEKLTLESLNSILYRSEAEEYDVSCGRNGAYDLPNYGKLVYCGLQGWVSVLRDVMFNNDLGHPISANLRDGYWALDYVINRLDNYINEPGVAEVQEWFRSRFDRVKKLPNYLAPSYFAFIIGIMYGCCRFRAMQLFPDHIGYSTLFIQSLALTSIQMVSKMKSTSIFPDKEVPAMAAGLPFFSTGYMRCWGRDVFISLRGLLLATGRFDEAKDHILAFAKTLKHGLIPNLLDAGRNPRYNARDAAWFFLQSVQDYIDSVPDGVQILKEKVTRRFPLDDTYIEYDDPLAFSYSSTIEEVVYEILARHAKGIKFREANAGPKIDRVMTDKGFDVEIYVDWETGLVHGGSQYNCGTWMDKMGESEKANSVGVPGTPRDGAVVEINGLLKSTLRFVIKMNEEGHFKFTEVENQNGEKVSFKKWNDLVQENFEKKFYIPLDPTDDKHYDIDSSIVNRRGIYKDLYKSGKPYEDYQFRPNFAIAMAVAPELFVPDHAAYAVRMADKILRGPIGMRTLDPSDYNYRPYYINSEDSTDFATSKGRNYHQGPEWTWCYGYFLRAYHHFEFISNPFAQSECKTKPSSLLFQQLYERLEHHRALIASSPWAGLPELTNKDGAVCNDSCPTQAWSTGCLLDLVFDLWVNHRRHWYEMELKRKDLKQ